MTRFRSTSDARLRWRVIVRTAGGLETSQAARPLAWHLVDCVDPVGPDDALQRWSAIVDRQ